MQCGVQPAAEAATAVDAVLLGRLLRRRRRTRTSQPQVKCFDENLRIGGVYTKSYDRTMLTTSSLLTAYSDYSDGREDRPKFWSDEEYLAYLDGFANEYELYQHVNFRSTVKKITKCAAHVAPPGSRLRPAGCPPP